MSTRTTIVCALTLISIGLRSSSASDTGQLIADQVDVVSYQDFLDNELFTHDGDNRGMFGVEHDLARDNIAAMFEGFGLEVELQSFNYGPIKGENVIGTQVGSLYPEAQYIVGAHYDSADNPGADDDASGVAGLLEIARVLTQYQPEYTIKYIAFDMEEWGLIGSSKYVDAHETDDIRGMIQLDMLAHTASDDIWQTALYGDSQADELKTALLIAVINYGHDLHVQLNGEANVSDHAPFSWAGFAAVLMSELDVYNNPCYHDECDSFDTPDYLTCEYAADQVRSVAGLLTDLAVISVPGNCEADANGDGTVDPLDVGFVLARFGCELGAGDADCEAANANGDFMVDPLDVGYVLARFGDCP